MKFVLLSFLVWRILLFTPVFIGSIFLPYRAGFEYTRYIYPWANFDGIHYLAIAKYGYTTEANFFPLFPILIRGLTPIFGGFFSGFLIANISFLFGLVFLYRLILLDYSEKVAKWAVIFLLIFPTSFYFGAVYTESVFLLLMASTLYYARKNNWMLSSILGMFSSATRLIGILILLALLYRYIKKEGFKFSIKLFPLFLIPAGLLSYAVFNFYKWGDYFYFIRAHGNLANSRSVDSIVLFPQTLFRYFKILTTLPASQYEWWIALLEVSVFFIVSILSYIAWKKKVKMEYLLFSIPTFLLPALSGTFSGLPRYVLVLFPIFIVFALIKSRSIKISYAIISPILLFILLMFFSRGYFVA